MSFFATLALSEIAPVLAVALIGLPEIPEDTIAIMSFAANYFVAPLFLLYLRRVLRPEDAVRPQREIMLHFSLPGFATARFDSLFVLAIVLVLVLWGLRAPVAVPPMPGAPFEAVDGDAAKYEKSALTFDRAECIRAKLLRAMQQDQLHRDPNVTLTALAQRLGVSTNRLSQTLNVHMGQSFFDFVNGLRVNEAIPLLLQSDKTVLEIAYEVGFNSRSSFDTAFKARTGCTPSEFKTADGAAPPSLA
ncbi:helix-turn-helix domain-containing protein [Roseobacter sinensis]|uniref:AraC family transcriptional regulator n=1 Tax=Roseobacter sinensis TaxID=2931391 RepID=A0ABT3BCR9_9RHOB|nr:AraC family transcriptional regulator [Roseobacter sp. WL0113]MCV3271352.1 AraC family transcriptional regulator [Roseobacter sp. WL0113]